MTNLSSLSNAVSDESESSSSFTTKMMMELVSLKGSPYSRRVKWALQLLNVDYNTTLYESMSGEPSLRWRLGRWNLCKPVTVPVAFITTAKTTKRDDDNEKIHENQHVLQLENGLDIVEWADDFASASSSNKKDSNIRLVPPSSRNKVIEYCTIADEIQDFGRSVFFDAIAEDPTLLRVFVGDDPPNQVLPVIAYVASTYF